MKIYYMQLSSGTNVYFTREAAPDWEDMINDPFSVEFSIGPVVVCEEDEEEEGMMSYGAYPYVGVPADSVAGYGEVPQEDISRFLLSVEDAATEDGYDVRAMLMKMAPATWSKGHKREPPKLTLVERPPDDELH